jgi:hypothetical protein
LFPIPKKEMPRESLFWTPLIPVIDKLPLMLSTGDSHK